MKEKSYNFCNQTKTNNCQNCKNKCSFKIEEIQSLKGKDLRSELKLHGHPQFRFIQQKRAKVSEMKKELYEHNKKNHKF